MLRGMRKASANWLGKIVMAAVVGFLALSFAVWGIGDIFRGFGLSRLARIGSTEITAEQFRDAYQRSLQILGRQLNRPITSDQARAFGFDRQVLYDLMSNAAMDERVRELKLNLSEAELARQIITDRRFRGADGQFNHQIFLARIRDIGFT